MSTSDALKLLIQAAEMAPLPKQGHIQISQAVEVLIKALAEKPKE